MVHALYVELEIIMDNKEIQRFINEHIPYRMHSIAWGLHLLKATREWSQLKRMEITFDGELSIQGYHPSLTNPSIEMAIVYSRVLLEFLGLGANRDKTGLSAVRSRKEGDVGIECFTASDGNNLSKVSVDDALYTYPGNLADAEKALLSVISNAHKAVAHLTVGPEKHDNFRELLELGCRGVLTLVHLKFYRAMGMEPPPYEVATKMLNKTP